MTDLPLDPEPDPRVLAVVERVRALPYAWPVPPDAAAARASGRGSCASKHALLAEELAALGVDSTPLLVAGRLVPATLADDPELAPGAALPEVHECLTVHAPWAGPVRVDVTWDPPLLARGLPGAAPWDGVTDQPLAVDDAVLAWSAPRQGLRAAKEALRARLYAPGDREVRDRVLAALAARLDALR